MRHGLAGAVGALALGWLTSVGWAEAPPPVELSMPPSTVEASSPGTHPLPETPVVVSVPSPARCGPRILGYGYDPAQGILTFTIHDDPSYLIWEGYTGPGRSPAWFAHCWSRVRTLCGR